MKAGPVILDKPFRPLLIQHAMPTLFAPNLIARLQAHARGAVTADIRRRRAIEGRRRDDAATTTTGGAEGILGCAQRWDLVCFAGHGGERPFWRFLERR
jgi:hypothetical protein